MPHDIGAPRRNETRTTGSMPQPQRNEIVVYQPDETLRLDVRLENETVWLTQGQMADLFQRDRTVITRHVSNVFSEGELAERGNVHFLHIPPSDKPVKIYSLNVVISVGYRENFHDRFLVVDDRELYLIGASLKDLGKKCFGFTKMDSAEIPGLMARM